MNYSHDCSQLHKKRAALGVATERAANKKYVYYIISFILGYVKQKEVFMPKLKPTPSQQREDNIVLVLRNALNAKKWKQRHLLELLLATEPSLRNLTESRLSLILNHPMDVKFETVLIVASKLGVESLPTR